MADEEGWPAKPITAFDPIPDHEVHPEYEVHVGRALSTATEGRTMRRVSVWIQGKHYSGYLTNPPPTI